MPKCKGCGAMMEWIKIDGKNIPLDTHKHPIYVYDAEVRSWRREPSARISHFATCPKASQFSGRAPQ